VKTVFLAKQLEKQVFMNIFWLVEGVAKAKV
jgi:hypothetical protein